MLGCNNSNLILAINVHFPSIKCLLQQFSASYSRRPMQVAVPFGLHLTEISSINQEIQPYLGGTQCRILP